MATNGVTLRLTDAELTLLQEAIDSHIYWTLADEHHRNDGAVDDVGSDEKDSADQIRDARELGQRLSNIEKGEDEEDEIEKDDEEPTILVTGNPVDGFTFIGPYANADEAIDDAPCDSDWWTAPLDAPESELAARGSEVRP